MTSSADVSYHSDSNRILFLIAYLYRANLATHVGSSESSVRARRSPPLQRHELLRIAGYLRASYRAQWQWQDEFAANVMRIVNRRTRGDSLAGCEHSRSR